MVAQGREGWRVDRWACETPGAGGGTPQGEVWGVWGNGAEDVEVVSEGGRKTVDGHQRGMVWCAWKGEEGEKITEDGHQRDMV